MSKERFADTTYSLAKSLHHVNIAREYLHDVKRDCHGAVKDLFNTYINKCDFIIHSMRDRLGEESKTILKNELKDSIILEAINDKLIHLNEQQRLEIENIIDEMIKKSKI